MKINYFNKSTSIKIILIVLCAIIIPSCNESDYLEEVPLDFYSPENSYVNSSNFEAATINLYATLRDEFHKKNIWSPYLAPRVTLNGTDLMGYDIGGGTNMNLLLNPSTGWVYTAWWKPCYQIIYDANVIIGRLQSESVEITEEEKVKFEAEARFFRGYMYMTLANIYGGVPIVLKETTEPKRDYVRATRNAVYEQCVEDLKFAAENLPGITEVEDSRISNLVAQHRLAEVYISLEQWGNAIAAASVVIDHPNTGLMTDRFGSRVNEEPLPEIPWSAGGDVYWDLFRYGNQNRSSGNTEALWVLQYEYNVTGGADGGYGWETNICPRSWRIQVEEPDGSNVPLMPSPNSYYGGRAGGMMGPGEYFFTTIWNRSGWDQDIRNAPHNIVRDIKVLNPNSSYVGKWIFEDNVPFVLSHFRDWFPIVTKLATMGDHPEDAWLDDQTVPGSISFVGEPTNTTIADIYELRLAETYLLRAEAYLGNENKVLAAADINVVRNRAQAEDVDSEDVDIDYILDERARELFIEENRMRTLLRLGLYVERNNTYNSVFDFAPHQNLWPIPYSEIEKNTGAVLEQNPGY